MIAYLRISTAFVITTVVLGWEGHFPLLHLALRNVMSLFSKRCHKDIVPFHSCDEDHVVYPTMHSRG